MKSKKMNKRVGKALAFAGLLFPALDAAAQAASETTPSPQREEVLRLDDFVVTTERVSGYRATNSITATGIGAAIGETPLMINVVTKDLISDTRSDLLIDALRFVPGVSSSPTNESQPFVRGFQGTYSLRNGVFRRQNLTTFNTERVEVIQGSASIFYSNIRPGGVINYITGKPLLRQTFADVTATGGSHNYYRGEGVFNVALGDTAALRFFLGHSSDDTFRRDFTERHNHIAAAFLWNLTPNHQILLEWAYEGVNRENTWSAYAAPLTNSRYWKNPAAIASGQTVSAWMAANHPGLPVYDMFAPFEPSPGDTWGRKTPLITNSFQRTIDRPVDFVYNGKLTDQLALSVTANYAYEDNRGQNLTGLGDIWADGVFRNNFRGELFINIRDSYNLNSKLVYRTQLAGMKHTLMVGNDNQWVTQTFPQVNGNANQFGPIINPYDPKVTRIDMTAHLAQPGATQFNTNRKREEFFGGTYIVDQMSALEERLFVLAGARYVDYWQDLWYQVTVPGATFPTPPPRYTAKEWTPQVGTLFKVGGGVAVFAGYSKSIEPQLGIDIESKRTVEPIEGEGFDVGVKLDMLGGALTGTIDYYEIKRTNVAIRDDVRNNQAGIPGGTPVAYYFFGNAQKVRGLQLDFNWAVNSNLQLIGQWNHFLQAENVRPQASPSMVGVRIFAQPDDMATLWAKYQFTEGSLEGLYIGGGPRYNSSANLGGNFNNTGVTLPSFTVLDLVAGYSTRLFERSVDFRLNVKNVFDKEYREGGGAFGADRSIYLSVHTRF
jgi:iron complex outermembrane recepter protein